MRLFPFLFFGLDVCIQKKLECWRKVKFACVIYRLLHLECHEISFSYLDLIGLFSTERGKRDVLLHLECHLISFSHLNRIGLFSTERGKRDVYNGMWQKRRAFWVSLNFILPSQSNWPLFNGTWQQRRRELDHGLSFKIGDMTLQMQWLCCVGQRAQCMTATHCNTLQHTATHCNTLQHTATHCNTLQRLCSVAQCMSTYSNYINVFKWYWRIQIILTYSNYVHVFRVARTHRVSYLASLCPAKEPYDSWLIYEKRPATCGLEDTRHKVARTPRISYLPCWLYAKEPYN